MTVTVTWLAQWIIAGTGIAGVVGGIITTIQARSAKIKMNAETAKLTGETRQIATSQADTINAMALRMLEPMQRRIDDLTVEVSVLERKIHALTDRLTLAQRLLTEHGVSFAPLPEV